MRTKIAALILMFVAVCVSTVAAKTNQTITVKINNHRAVAKTNLTIKFAALVDDSRCPTGTNCIWAGNGKIQIQIKTGKSAWKTFELNTNLKPQTVDFAGYTIKLIGLNPHPANNVRIDRNGYTANFEVVRIVK